MIFVIYTNNAVGINPNDYDEYRYIEEHFPSELDQWLKEHVVALSSIDYQRL